jgi:hypothetical protein
MSHFDGRLHDWQWESASMTLTERRGALSIDLGKDRPGVSMDATSSDDGTRMASLGARTGTGCNAVFNANDLQVDGRPHTTAKVEIDSGKGDKIEVSAKRVDFEGRIFGGPSIELHDEYLAKSQLGEMKSFPPAVVTLNSQSGQPSFTLQALGAPVPHPRLKDYRDIPAVGTVTLSASGMDGAAVSLADAKGTERIKLGSTTLVTTEGPFKGQKTTTPPSSIVLFDDEGKVTRSLP